MYTLTANCHDCYRCVRVCPVKAIRVHDGQASVERELCIGCGTCVRECPQHAKLIRRSLEEVQEMVVHKKVAVSMAPSFPAFFPRTLWLKLPAALKKLGFSYVSETAEGAKKITEDSFNIDNGGTICTACPAVVNYIEKYRPDYRDHLIPVTSPMVAHGRMLKHRLGSDWSVVFIGPCSAKKQEALRPENRDAINGVLTFEELAQWLEDAGIDFQSLKEETFESRGVLSEARLFPLQGGMLKTGQLPVDNIDPNVLHISGPEEVEALFDLPLDSWTYRYVEPLFCAGGCINGAGFPSEKNLFLRKQDVLAYAKLLRDTQQEDIDRSILCGTSFHESYPKTYYSLVSEELINDILEKTGKSSPDLQLNCGACGYKTCRDSAIAVVKGMAQPEMCMPYMRRLAIQKTDKIMETSPNGIVLLDENLHILHMNPAFKAMFLCNNAVLGKRISYLLDGYGYEKMVEASQSKHEYINAKYGVKYQEIAYYLPDENQYVGIYINLSKIKFDDRQLDLIKGQTMENIKELLHHQINFSQELAHFLGANTAKSEELLQRLMNLFE
ncbi:4Fe-4S binding protein [Alkalibacter rhizosphaerae]|uniref:4Fe-4S binding protein n=1 Tax=Alkalibacter rhizosphaerae TaxID=2815577 RepID=A0A974XFZ9_9FIRM|nr:[Fe-Fe] hydrogenase large subunit C-terminal domain-containing protein [Alkalibacter rhizosphaerae]QSX09056.1 4Fe-4S binding protein [Alkalibacter rhizosphaerae]